MPVVAAVAASIIGGKLQATAWGVWCILVALPEYTANALGARPAHDAIRRIFCDIDLN